MKIGTITFHWANNYGAVLQTFALQRFLLNNGYDSEVINYLPLKLYGRERVRNIVRRDHVKIGKFKKIQVFIKNNIKLSNKTYFVSRGLESEDYSIVICGSDQVWNEWFLHHAERKTCLAYFLDFVNDGCRRISYAVSFGTNTLGEDTKKEIKPELDKFSDISVRENTAVDILSELDIGARRVCDPTLLLKKEDYEKIIENSSFPECSDYIYSYILHGEEQKAAEVIDIISRTYNINTCVDNSIVLGVPEWMEAIRVAKYVVTNSFHATVFSIIFHKKFITLPVDGKDMNDRIYTLLSDLNLSSRFYESGSLQEILQEEINWLDVDRRVIAMRTASTDWLLKAIGR